MSKSKNIILASSVLMSVCMVVIALSLTLYLPNGAWQKRAVIVLLVALSPVPLVTAIVALRSLSACAGTADRFAIRDPLTSLYNQSAFWDLLEYEAQAYIVAKRILDKTIAEYVETEAILGNVQSAGIDYAQGYYIQHPSPHLRADGYL